MKRLTERIEKEEYVQRKLFVLLSTTSALKAI